MLWQLETGEDGAHVLEGTRVRDSTMSPLVAVAASMAGGTERTSVHDSATGVQQRVRPSVRTPPSAVPADDIAQATQLDAADLPEQLHLDGQNERRALLAASTLDVRIVSGLRTDRSWILCLITDCWQPQA